MNEKVNFCKLCNKNYSSKSSLCNHNKKFHNNSTTTICQENGKKWKESGKKCQENDKNSPLEKTTNISCEFCKKIFNSRQGKNYHIKKCTIKLQRDKVEQQNRSDYEVKLKQEYELKLKSEEAKILKLKLKIQNSNKVGTVTIKKLNKMLLERRNYMNQITNSNNNNSNNNINYVQNNNNIIHNNYQLIGFGKDSEEIQKLLTYQEKRQIINAKMNSLNKLIEIVHCGGYNQFKNVIITNIKDKFMYKYDDKTGVFVLSTKEEIMNSLLINRMNDLEVIYDELIDLKRVDDKTKNSIENFINRMNYEDKDSERESFKELKINEIKMMLYNSIDKISGDISLILTAEEVEKVTDVIDHQNHKMDIF